MKRTRTIIQLIVITLIIACLAAMGYTEYGKITQTSAVPTFIPVAAVATVTPIPEPKLQTSSMDSPEGSKTLTVERVEYARSASYSVFVTEKQGGERIDLMTHDATFQDLTIPYNTWSPDTGYFFLKETTADRSDYRVFQSSGDRFPEDILSLSIPSLFTESVQGFVIEDVTGWASATQIIVNTRGIETDAKVSFWFDVPSQTFTQLGTYFK